MGKLVIGMYLFRLRWKMHPENMRGWVRHGMYDGRILFNLPYDYHIHYQLWEEITDPFMHGWSLEMHK